MAIKKVTKKEKIKPKVKKISFFRVLVSFARRIKASYFTIGLVLAFLMIFLLGLFIGAAGIILTTKGSTAVIVEGQKQEYWLELKRKSQKEYLYFGVAGDKGKSKLVKTFTVKTGVPGQRPTPLPQALGKNYWKITKKYPSVENPETAPYFLELDIPIEEGYFGPVPYNECEGQCSWELPGYFGLHGVNGDLSRLDKDNLGSSGCVRHSDQDITYLYNLLNVDEGVRYYIIDS